MALDIRTVLFLLFLVSALLALMLLVFWKTQKTYEGFSIWTGASILSSIGYLFLMLREGVPWYLTIVVGNLCILISVLMRMDSMDRFGGTNTVPRLVYALTLPVLAFLLYFTLVTDSVAIRGLAVAVVIIPAILYLAALILGYRQKEIRLICIPFASALILFAGVYAVRTLYWISSTPISVFSPDTYNILFFRVTLIVDILATGFFLMLNMARSAADLTASEERFRTIFSLSQVGMALIDPVTHKILQVNKKALELTGRTEIDVNGKICHAFICTAEKGKCPVTDLGQTVESSERYIVKDDGSRIPVLKTVISAHLGDQPVLIESFVDITDHKRTEDALREANKKLNLLSGITRHDIRNQLLALDGYIELAQLSVQEEDPSAVSEYLSKEKTITRNIAHQIEVTRDYEDLGVHSPLWQDINAVIRATIPRLESGKVAITVQEPGPEIFADPLLEKVFFNLFDNALRYGGDSLAAIRVSYRISDRCLVITVEDNGAGISYADKGQLFTKGFGKHTGLGLFLSREILGITGITITETGIPGAGARFEMVVPDGAWRYRDRPDTP